MFGPDEKKFILYRITIFIVLSTLHANGYKNKKLIHILIWTPPNLEPFNFIDMEQKAFRNCTFKNCFLTGNHSYFENIKDFDVLMFNVVNLNDYLEIPPVRSPTQKYCMYGVEPAAYHRVAENWDKFFNITFTYKLSSNITIPCVVVQNEKNEVIGPKTDMHWLKLSEMNETSAYVKNKLRNKHIAAAWLVSHCESPWRRIYAQNLQSELARYGRTLDIYGKCGTKQCPQGAYGICGNIGNIMCPRNERMDECLAIIESDYYFYLAFENSFGEDYVTEKLLHGLQHFTVPVVFGSANYSRFMPDGIYLDANVMPPDEMAATMNDIINDVNKYYDFFKWYDHYSFSFSGESRYSREMCRLCAFLNNNKNKISVIENISKWWNVELPPRPEEPEPPNSFEKVISNFFNILDPSD